MTNSAVSPAVGIDLGTTCSCVAYLDEHGRPQILVNSEGERLTPSVVLFEADDAVVGREALRALGSDPLLVAWCAKRSLGRRFYPHPLGGRQYAPEASEAWILNKLRLDASRQIGRVERAVITVPAYFDEVRRKATVDAAYMAGLDVLEIMNEPTAAAVAYGQRWLDTPHTRKHAVERRDPPDRPKHILVYDLGGGTF
ncbi:MAG TPA: Hsp70 family protein, partial [Pirellulaceae bacterium]